MSLLKRATDSRRRFLLLGVRDKTSPRRLQALGQGTGRLEDWQTTATLLLYRYPGALPGHRRTEGITAVQALCWGAPTLYALGQSAGTPSGYSGCPGVQGHWGHVAGQGQRGWVQSSTPVQMHRGRCHQGTGVAPGHRLLQTPLGYSRTAGAQAPRERHCWGAATLLGCSLTSGCSHTPRVQSDRRVLACTLRDTATQKHSQCLPRDATQTGWLPQGQKTGRLVGDPAGICHPDPALQAPGSCTHLRWHRGARVLLGWWCQGWSQLAGWGCSRELPC